MTTAEPTPQRRYIVTGSRGWRCADVADRVIHGLLARHDNTFVVVHGDAPGVDTAFRAVCERLGVAHEPHPARWDAVDDPRALVRQRKDGSVYAANAGPIRNAEMVALGADYAIAVHRDLASSKGTLGMVRLCLAAQITVYLIDGVNPTRRLTEDDLP